MFLKAVSAARLEGLVTTNLSFYLSAHDTDSYPGTGITWTDISTNQNKAILTNGPVYSANDGGYIDFDGTNDYADATGTTGSPFNFGTGTFTLEYLVYYDTAANPMTIIDWRRRDINNSSNEGLVDTRSTGRNWRYFYKNGFILTSTGTLSDGVWHHVALVRNSTGTNDTKLYINNVLDSSHTWNYTISDYNNFYLGRNKETTTPYLNGRIAQIRAYKGSALTPAQITQNWNAHRRLYGR